MAHGDKLITQGARLKCNQTQLLVPGVFNCLNPLHQISGHYVSTELDFVPLYNVLPFPSPCKILSAAAAGTPMPCVPFPTPWQGAHPGVLSMGRKLLLDSSYTYCAIGGKIEFSSAGQAVVSLGPVSTPPSPPVLPPQRRLLVEPGIPPAQAATMTPAELAAAKKANATAWSATLNQVPLEANAHYLVGNSLYETDAEGRVVKMRGVLTLPPPVRDQEEQRAAPRKKDGLTNPNHVPDPRTDAQKQAGVADGRSLLQRREYVDDGGHLRGAQFGGAKEQINYVPQHMNQNQARKNADNWHAMEREWARQLRRRPPSHVYVEQTIRYPRRSGSSITGQSMRPGRIKVDYWSNGIKKTEQFSQ